MKINLDKLTTEKRNPLTMDIDILSTEDMVRVINDEDKKVALAVEKQIPNISKSIDIISEKLMKGGRLIYIGAGTSGRMGILDASECPPTFGVSHDLVQGLIAGGTPAILKAIEGAEDSKEEGAKDLRTINFSKKDVLVGIAASGRTPYVIGALEYAKDIGAVTIGLTNNYEAEICKYADICIAVEVGGEVITGSTRMKAGTAQKMVLNMLSTGTMIKLGKVYENLMVDVEATNLKLIERSKRIVMEATGVDLEDADKYLRETDNDVKLAILMIMGNLDKKMAEKLLRESNGHIRKALNMNHKK